MRQWVESEPCGQLELCLGVSPLPPAGVSLELRANQSPMTDLLYFPYENHQFARRSRAPRSSIILHICCKMKFWCRSQNPHFGGWGGWGGGGALSSRSSRKKMYRL